MSGVFFQELGIPAPDHDLEVGYGSHAAQTANIMLAFEPVCLHEKPDWVVVVGDVNSTLACTMVAAKLGIPAIALFPMTPPEQKDAEGTESTNPHNLICRAARLLKHEYPDIGLVGVPRQIIRRWQEDPHSLADAERALIEQHPILGQELATFVSHLDQVGVIIRAHHERKRRSRRPTPPFP